MIQNFRIRPLQDYKKTRNHIKDFESLVPLKINCSTKQSTGQRITQNTNGSKNKRLETHTYI